MNANCAGSGSRLQCLGNPGLEFWNVEIRLGFAVALVAGVLSACFNFGHEDGSSLATIATDHGAPAVYSTQVC
jgi:hypothetical protein